MKYLTQQLFGYFKQHKLRYAFVLIIMIVSSAAAVVPTYIIRLFIDAIITKKLTYGIFENYILLFLLTILFVYITDILWTYFLYNGSYDLQSELRTGMMRHFLKMGAPFYQRFRTGDLMTRSNDDVQVMGMTAGYGLMVFLNSSFYLFFILLMMSVSVSWVLTIIAIIPMPVIAYYFFKWGSEIDRSFTEVQDSVSKMNDEVLEIVDGIRVVRAFGTEKAMSAKFNDRTEETKQKIDRVAELDSRFIPLITIMLAISYVLSFGFGALLVARQKITIGAMISFQVYLTMIVWPMISAGDLVNVLQQGTASWRRINEVLETSDRLESQGTQEIRELQSIELNDYDFSYPDNQRKALSGINLLIKKGQVIGIVGRTGSGKTTIIRQFGHRYPYSNQVPTINGQPLLTFKTEAVRNQFAEVPQEHTLFSRSIRENLLFGNPNATDDRIWEVLEVACLAEDIRRMKEGLDTLVGEKGVSLSGGQKQRLSLARAFLRNSPVLLLDDALSAVDAKTEQTIITNLATQEMTNTSLIITHRLSAVTSADKIYVLDDGKIIQEGTHESLINESGWYQKQYHHQQLKEDDSDA